MDMPGATLGSANAERFRSALGRWGRPQFPHTARLGITPEARNGDLHLFRLGLTGLHCTGIYWESVCGTGENWRLGCRS